MSIGTFWITSVSFSGRLDSLIVMGIEHEPLGWKVPCRVGSRGPKRRDDGFDRAGFNQPIPEAVAA